MFQTFHIHVMLEDCAHWFLEITALLAPPCTLTKALKNYSFHSDFKDKHEQHGVCNSIPRVKIFLTLRPQAAQRAGLNCGIRLIS